MFGKAPWFWSGEGPISRALSPISTIVTDVTARRVARPGWQAPVPVLCCGNASVGGTGKTIVALDLLARLLTRGLAPHALLRGHGGRVRGPHRVEPGDVARTVGDEALLLAAVAPTWVGGDRAASARAAIGAGAGCLVMDDGLQNSSLEKVSFLVIDGAAGFGNGRVLPAGPLREPIAAAAARCVAAVLIGEDKRDVTRTLMLPILRARLAPNAAMRALSGVRIVAFAGIGRPEKFFDSLREAGTETVHTVPFPDHHVYTRTDIARLRSISAASRARLVTTPKDAVRLRDAPDVLSAGVDLVWNDPRMIDALLPS